jgi:hypothetical protein
MVIKLCAAALIGIGLGVIGARYLFVGSFLSLIPWGTAGLLLGIWCAAYRKAIVTGALYGFLLVFSFMIAGYGGSASLLSRLPFFAILGLVGAVCGIVLGVIGTFFRLKLISTLKTGSA